ncbi:unnamed protein product [Phyllotreta striolata]|uniref:Fibronectin type-III domain-containing protein n=1 Tax=Phyllotreta striolata TaxID=444603 RepID=A0A9N9TTM4_PHYSR|nr:unnamed protein product [Phyllotreta striolata]
MLGPVLVFVLCRFGYAAGYNVSYFAGAGPSERFSASCVAEELERYSGIDWIYPLGIAGERGLPTLVNKYIPKIENDFNCQFAENSHCNSIWALRDWQIDRSSPKTKEFIADIRWEDLPTILISNKTKEFGDKIEVEKVHKTAFSVRADGEVEIIISSGPDPYSYPCYYLNVGHREIYLKKYDALPKSIGLDYKNNYVDNYKTYSNILTPNQWRSFSLNSNSDNGRIELIDVNLNRTLIDTIDKNPVFSSHLFMRSANSSLWKFHQNSFLFTNTTQISRLGPQLFLPYKDLCVSLLVKTCSDCQMTFFYVNTTRKILKTVGPIKNNEWAEVKLKEENAQYKKLNIFVETKRLHSNSNESGYWAIDNVRVCHENEVKVSYLTLDVSGQNITHDNVTCQLIKDPVWRPKMFVYDQQEVSPKITSRSTDNSILLRFPDLNETNSLSLYVFYQANDRCTTSPFDMNRLKSNGLARTKSNQLLLTDLIPYTLYNITISSVVQDKDFHTIMKTLETAEPTLGELPFPIQLKASDTSIRVSWDPVSCSKMRGRLVYTLIVSNATLNFSKKISLQTDTSYDIEGLRPYTHYSLNILTARNARHLYNGELTTNYTMEFTTMPGVAPPPENLEIYSLDEHSASLRYDLPANTNGVTRQVQVIRCNSLSSSKCKPAMSVVKRCSLWPKKYCVEAGPLIPGQSYKFRVSLRNLNTPAYGDESVVQGTAAQRVPGAPTNVTYKVAECPKEKDYCNVDVSWLHPFIQNGTINSFEIVLNGTDTKERKEIHEVINDTYFYEYTHQIKNLPYSELFDLKVRSVNEAFKSDFAHLRFKMDDLGNHINQSLELVGSGPSTLQFKVPNVDKRLEYYTLTVVVQDYDKSIKIDEDILENGKIVDHLCHMYGRTWVSQVVKVEKKDAGKIITIGNAEKERLEAGDKYCIVFIITNKYRGSEHDVVYYEKLRTKEARGPPKESTSGGSSNHLYMLLFVLLAIPIGFVIFRYLRKKRILKESMRINEHRTYETLPCEEIGLINTDRANGRLTNNK